MWNEKIKGRHKAYTPTAPPAAQLREERLVCLSAPALAPQPGCAAAFGLGLQRGDVRAVEAAAGVGGRGELVAAEQLGLVAAQHAERRRPAREGDRAPPEGDAAPAAARVQAFREGLYKNPDGRLYLSDGASSRA